MDRYRTIVDDHSSDEYMAWQFIQRRKNREKSNNG